MNNRKVNNNLKKKKRKKRLLFVSDLQSPPNTEACLDRKTFRPYCFNALTGPESKEKSKTEH